MDSSCGGSVFELSHEIFGHSADVRVVRSFHVCEEEVSASPTGAGRETAFTASRDGTACVWEPEAGDSSTAGFVLRKVMRQHSGHVSALCVVPPGEYDAQSQTMILTGGQDGKVLLHSLEEAMEEPLESFRGHTQMVTCILHQNKQMISCSWDGTIRVWRFGEGGRPLKVMERHQPAVWAVTGLYAFDGSNRILSCGADRTVCLWEVESGLCVQEYRGHADVVRDVKVMTPELFISASNDCTIRKWNIHSGQCLREIYGHEAYIYSISVFPGGGMEGDFVSSGEDGTVRVWRGEECQQIIRLPAASVWSVWCMSNGDVIAGSSDSVARIFTISAERKAPAATIANFRAKVEEYQSSKGKIDVDSLPGMDALSKPGKKSGDTCMVNNNGIPEVYQWNEVSLQWEKIGNAVGQAPESSSVYQGKEYDYVFEIELDEGSPTMRKLKLPYNKTTDPYIAAQEFLDANNLPPMYLDEVAEFIIKNAGEYQRSSAVQNYDPFTGGQAYVPEGRRQPVSGGGLDPFTGGSSYRSSGGAGNGYTGNVPVESDHHKSQVKVKNTFFPMVDYMTFSSPESYTEKVIQKIHEFNSEVAENLRISEDCLSRLPVLCKLLTTQTSSSIETEHFHVIESVLKWPVDKLFPGLDLLRLSLLHKSGNAHFTGDEDSGKVFLGELIAFAVGSQPEAKNQLLVLRCLANMFALPSSAQLMDYERKWLLSEVSPLYQSDSKPFQTALATLVLNYCHFYASKKCPDGIADCVQCCMRVLNSSFNLEAKFRAMVGIGSLATFDRALVKRSTSSVDLVSLLQPLCSVLDPSKVGNCAEVLLDVIA